MQRRDFLKSVSAAAGASAALEGLSGINAAAAAPEALTQLPKPEEAVRGDMRYRALGRTGEQVSAIGLGGHHIGRQKDERDSIKIVRSAIDRGITFMDNSWDYHDGGSELRMGKALREGYRNKVFLMTNVLVRSSTGIDRPVFV
jgi:aldo/keto reductase family protein